MVKTVSYCCVHGSWDSSNPVTILSELHWIVEITMIIHKLTNEQLLEVHSYFIAISPEEAWLVGDPKRIARL